MKQIYEDANVYAKWKVFIYLICEVYSDALMGPGGGKYNGGGE